MGFIKCKGIPARNFNRRGLIKEIMNRLIEERVTIRIQTCVTATDSRGQESNTENIEQILANPEICVKRRYG